MGSICITQYFALSKVSTLYAGPFILKSPTNCLIKGGNNEKANTADQEVIVIGPYSASNQCNRKSSEKCFRYLCLVNDNDKFHFICKKVNCLCVEAPVHCLCKTLCSTSTEIRHICAVFFFSCTVVKKKES